MQVIITMARLSSTLQKQNTLRQKKLNRVVHLISETEDNSYLRGTQSTTRKQAMRKRTREGQSCMFSMKIWPPRKERSRTAIAR